MKPVIKLISGTKEYTDLSKRIEGDNKCEGVRQIINDRFPTEIAEKIREEGTTMVARMLDGSGFRYEPGTVSQGLFAEARAALETN